MINNERNTNSTTDQKVSGLNPDAVTLTGKGFIKLRPFLFV